MKNNMTKKLLITGGSGFVGQNVIHFLLEHRPDIEITNFSSAPINLPGVINIIGDATNFDLSTLKGDYDYIIHLLALSNEKYCEDFDLAEKINIIFTKKMLDVARRQTKLKKFIHMSSISIYGQDNVSPVAEDGMVNVDNDNTYSFTKVISGYYANFYLRKYRLPIIVFRLSNIYGPYQDFRNSPFLVASKIAQGVNEKQITVFSLKPRRDWIYSEDAAEAIAISLDTDATGVYNLASGYGLSVEEVVGEIAGQLGVAYHSLDKPMSGLMDFYCDITKIKKDIAWSPKTGLKEGIAKTIKHYKNNYLMTLLCACLVRTYSFLA